MRILHHLPLLVVTGLAACTFTSSNDISEQRFRADVQELASDRYQGRLPTGPGEPLTLAFLQSAFETMGVEPGNNGSYLQAVPMVRHTTESAKLNIGGDDYRFLYDMVLNSFRDQPSIKLDNSDVVFVGYGINAPEYGWNDYHGLDVKGKTVVMLVNDPGYATGAPQLFKGNTMTYYGRWDYKFAEAGRQGASAALIIHDTKPASYPWMVVQNSWSGPQLGLEGVEEPHPILEGWIKKGAAKQMLAKAGLNLERLMDQAKQGATNVSLGLKAKASLEQQIESATSYNVIATLPGQHRQEEHVLYSAHWDHIGTKGDKIYNGAMDNATGVAGILEIARAFTRGPMPKRSVSFLVVTGEEQGLLGSRYYAANPVYPLDKTVGVFNFDSTNVYGPTKDYVVVGRGQSSLETYLEKPATERGRTLVREPNPASGGYFRSDHFSFAQRGVPAIFAGGGSKPVDDAAAERRKALKALMKGCYHNTCDVYREEWDLTGTMEDIAIYYEAGFALANDDRWPGFHAGSEFYNLRPAL